MDGQETNRREDYPNDGKEGGPCPYCGSRDVVTRLKVDQIADAGRIGFAYRATAIFGGAERLYADLCRGCGSVVRLFVKNPQRDWIQEKD